MDSTLALILLALSFISIISTPTFATEFTADADLRCGGTLTARVNYPIDISYSIDQPFGENERCVWIVRALNATHYNFFINDLGFPQSDDDHRLVVTPLEFQADYPHHKVINETQDFITSGPAVLITFQTGPSNPSGYHGFALSITPSDATDYQRVYNQSIDVLPSNQNLSGTLRHPESGMYGPRELSVFVFPPYNNTFDPTKRTEVNYTRIWIGTFCFDTIAVFNFDVTRDRDPHRWYHYIECVDHQR